MTQKLSPAAAREIWAVLAREAKPTQGEKFTDLKDHLFYLLNDLQCRIDEDPEAKPLGWWLDKDDDQDESIEDIVEHGTCAAFRHILTRGASLHIPLQMLENGFSKQVVKTILKTVFKIPDHQIGEIPSSNQFPPGTNLVIKADPRGVSVCAEVSKEQTLN